MQTNLKEKKTRNEEMLADFLELVDRHLDDILCGRAEKLNRIKDFSASLFIHPTHFSDSIKAVSGRSPWRLYEQRIIAEVKKLLMSPSVPIVCISDLFCFSEPTNFTKFFKRRAGCTPTEYRKRWGVVLTKDAENALAA